jgi:hypothetical protein
VVGLTTKKMGLPYFSNSIKVALQVWTMIKYCDISDSVAHMIIALYPLQKG